MSYQYSFEKLHVWQNAREMTKMIYLHTKDYPVEEKFGLVSQMRRAIISVSSNIVEGSSRTSKRDQAHFYNMAFGSLLELLSQVILSNDLNYITKDEYEKLRTSIEQISNQLNSLRNAITSKP